MASLPRSSRVLSFSHPITISELQTKLLSVANACVTSIDSAGAAAEFGAEFRKDIEDFISIERVESCVVSGIAERFPIQGKQYHGFVDPSGGSKDAFTLAIAHKEN